MSKEQCYSSAPMLGDPYRTVRVRRESGRLLSHVSHLAGVPVADVPAAVIAALGGPERAAAEVLRRRAAALGLGDAVRGGRRLWIWNANGDGLKSRNSGNVKQVTTRRPNGESYSGQSE